MVWTFRIPPMKTSLILWALASCAFATTPILERATPEALIKLRQIDPMSSMEKPAEDVISASRQQSQSLIEQSTILCFGGHWTFVPPKAVIHLPAALKARVNTAPSGSLLPWVEFLTKNPNWITTNEVTFDQAAGNEPIPAERMAFLTKQDKVVVAVHQTGPISVHMAESNAQLASK